MKFQFNGKRLKQARIYRGLTKNELAEKMECQRQTISAYENNSKANPSDNTVRRMAKELKFPVQFFYEDEHNVEIGATYFRALLTTSKKYREEQEQKMEFLAAIYVFLQDYLDFPALNIPDCTGKTPAEAAMLLRQQWNLGVKPIANIINEVENNGILVTTFDTSTTDIDAFSQMLLIEGKPIYLVAYSNNKTSAARIHFDIAHELGHICLHGFDEKIEDLEKDEFRQREKEANEFAATFLLPAETFKPDIENIPLRIPAYKRLKTKWKVSIQAMFRRAYSLNVISMDEYQAMIRLLQRQGLRKNEPLDDVLLTAEPALLKTAVLMLLNENVFTAREFVDELSFSYHLSLLPEDVEFLLHLPKGTLNQTEIISFSELKLKKMKKDQGSDLGRIME